MSGTASRSLAFECLVYPLLDYSDCHLLGYLNPVVPPATNLSKRVEAIEHARKRAQFPTRENLRSCSEVFAMTRPAPFLESYW